MTPDANADADLTQPPAAPRTLGGDATLPPAAPGTADVSADATDPRLAEWEG